MAGLLFLHAGSPMAREVYRLEERAYWSSGLPMVLEKHGYLQVRCVAQADADSKPWSSYDCAVVARLPMQAWSDGLAQGLLESEVPALLEGPLPPALRSALGIRDTSAGPREVDVTVLPGTIAEAAKANGYPAGGRIAPPTTRRVERDPSMDWPSLPSVPLSPTQADRWRAPGWDVERWTLDPDVEVLAEWRPHGDTGRWPAVIRRGKLTACSIGLMAALVQSHTAEPWFRGEFRSSPRSTGLEHLMLALIDDLHRQAGAVRARTLPWPRGCTWVLNVRHDFDRFLSPRRVGRVLAEHARVGTAATWYWRARYLAPTGPWRWLGSSGNEAARLVAGTARQEVAHHTERLWDGAEHEQERIERTIQMPVRGTSSHGDPTCFRFQGAPNVIWADRARLSYTELIQHAHFHPHRCALLSDDGDIRPSDVLCLPHHESLDRSVRPGDTLADRLRERQPLWRRVNGMLQVMNHPDINTAELFELLLEFPKEGRYDWTAAECADWWRRSHVLDQLEISTLGHDSFRVSSTPGVENLAVELLLPTGRRQVRIIDVPARASVRIVAGSR